MSWAVVLEREQRNITLLKEGCSLRFATGRFSSIFWTKRGCSRNYIVLNNLLRAAVWAQTKNREWFSMHNILKMPQLWRSNVYASVNDTGSPRFRVEMILKDFLVQSLASSISHQVFEIRKWIQKFLKINIYQITMGYSYKAVYNRF